MTTNTFTGPFSHASNADFRAWGLALSNCLTAAGLATAGDTGQINWASVNRPANLTAAGYEIRYLNDSLHATKPCYIKIEFGTDNSTDWPAFWITVASATNGAGTVAGTTYFARRLITRGFAPSTGNYSTFCCVLEGYIALVSWLGAKEDAPKFVLCRTTDSMGNITTDGFYLYYANTSLLDRNTYITTETTDVNKTCLFPGNLPTVYIGTDTQLFRHFGFVANYETQCIPFVLTFLNNDLGALTIFSTTPVGSTSRTYLAFSGTATGIVSSVVAGTALSSARLAIQWE